MRLLVIILVACAGTSCQKSATVHAPSPDERSMSEVAIGETVGTCSFRIHDDDTIWLFDIPHHFTSTPCIKVRREKDGWVAILRKGESYTRSQPLFFAGWISGETPVKSVEYEQSEGAAQ